MRHSTKIVVLGKIITKLLIDFQEYNIRFPEL